jgi:hypothetical protein
VLVDGEREKVWFVAARDDERMTRRQWKRIEEGSSRLALGKEIPLAKPMAEGTRGLWLIHGRSIPAALGA